MANKGEDVVRIIKDVSENGRSCKQSTTIYSLAVCARSNDLKTKNAAYRALVCVCRIPTHLFEFVKYCENESAGTGWGRAHRVAIGKWYNKTQYKKDPVKLALHVTKYQSRHSWSHRDVLRLAHIRPETPAISRVIRYIVKGLSEAKSAPMPMDDNTFGEDQVKKVLDFLEAVEIGKKCKRAEVEKMKTLISTYNLAREHVPTSMLDSIEIWDVLFRQMPMTAMIRNLGKMSRLGMFSSESYYENLVVTKLTEPNILKCAKIHPFTILVAWYQYQAGKGDKGKLTWPVNNKIVKALEDGFYQAFRYVEPTGKRYLLAVDVSGSMTAPVVGSSTITCRDAAAAMMLLTLKAEQGKCDVMAFSETFTKLDVTENDDMKTAIDKCSRLPFSRTDCSLPMKYACEMKKNYDVFVVFTDSETFFGNIHPARALVEYRKYSGIEDARLIVCGMATNGFSIADPSDRYMLDVVGFDTEAPRAMTTFINGEFDQI